MTQGVIQEKYLTPFLVSQIRTTNKTSNLLVTYAASYMEFGGDGSIQKMDVCQESLDVLVKVIRVKVSFVLEYVD